MVNILTAPAEEALIIRVTGREDLPVCRDLLHGALMAERPAHVFAVHGEAAVLAARCVLTDTGWLILTTRASIRMPEPIKVLASAMRVVESMLDAVREGTI